MKNYYGKALYCFIVKVDVCLYYLVVWQKKLMAKLVNFYKVQMNLCDLFIKIRWEILDFSISCCAIGVCIIVYNMFTGENLGRLLYVLSFIVSFIFLARCFRNYLDISARNCILNVFQVFLFQMRSTFISEKLGVIIEFSYSHTIPNRRKVLGFQTNSRLKQIPCNLGAWGVGKLLLFAY